MIVGENDAVKSSSIDCLKVVTQNKPIEIDDYNYDCNKIKLESEIENLVFIKAYEDFKIENAHFPNFNNIQLDGKQFENVSSFFKEVFLKEKQSSIWKEKIQPGNTIESFIMTRIDKCHLRNLGEAGRG